MSNTTKNISISFQILNSHNKQSLAIASTLFATSFSSAFLPLLVPKLVNMKNQASIVMKQVVSTLLSFVKAKSMAVKNKTSAMKTRLMILGILRNKKILMSSITHKIHALTGHGKERDVDGDNEDSKAIVLYNTEATEGRLSSDQMYSTIVENDDDDDDKYPDLRHCLFDGDDELGDCNGSVIDLVRNNRKEGMEFKLEDEIDQVADLFIRKFHKKMWLQKQQSFKMYQEMLARGT